MGDIRNPTLLWIKGGLFVVLGVISAGLLLKREPSWTTALLLAICVWAFCRAYYFAFYVVEHYADPGYRFAGLGSFVRYAMSRRRDDSRTIGEVDRQTDQADVTDGDLLRIAEESPGGEKVAVAVFGSYATGRARPDSDVDMVCYVRSIPEDAAQRYTIRFVGNRMVCVLLKRLDEVFEELKHPEEAVWAVPSLRRARVLLDKNGEFDRVRDEAERFDWAPLQEAANAYAGRRLVKFSEETLKLGSALRRSDEKAVFTETTWLVLGLPMILAVQGGIFLENETKASWQVQEAVGMDCPWSRLYRQAAGHDAPSQGVGILGRGAAALGLYRETVRLLDDCLAHEHREVIECVLKIHQELFPPQ